MWCSRVSNYGYRCSQQRFFYKMHKNNIAEWEMQEYTKEPQYPPIVDLSLKARKQEEREKWFQNIQTTNTVEEKLLAVNMPRYYGHKVVHMSAEKLPYNPLPVLQFYTRTAFEVLQKAEKSSDEAVESNKKEESGVASASLHKSLSGDIQDAIVYAEALFRSQASYPEMSKEQRDYKLGHIIVGQVNRIVMNALSSAHLRELECDYEPRHEAFWCVGGIDPPKNVRKSKEGRKWQKDTANEPVDRLMQFQGQPYLCLRHSKQLPAWQSFESASETDKQQIMPYRFDPRTLGYSTTKNVHVTNIPGFWPGTSAPFGYLMYYPRHFLNLRPSSFGDQDVQDTLHAQALQCSFAWLLSLSAYNGFDTFNDLTYPMNTQTILTNGRHWSFYEYQLNTICLNGEKSVSNPRMNYCRGTPEMALYEEVSAEGKCIGFNDEVLAQLVKCALNVPTVELSGNEMQPFLHEKYKHAADYENDEKRVFLENKYKHLAANRGRHLEEPEIYMWERLYKIDNKTRSLEPRRRFFELDINPWKRTLDQHQKEYIPRCKRVNGPKDKKNKWMLTHYPQSKTN